jgi:hypothetical protein
MGGGRVGEQRERRGGVVPLDGTIERIGGIESGANGRDRVKRIHPRPLRQRAGIRPSLARRISRALSIVERGRAPTVPRTDATEEDLHARVIAVDADDRAGRREFPPQLGCDRVVRHLEEPTVSRQQPEQCQLVLREVVDAEVLADRTEGDEPLVDVADGEWRGRRRGGVGGEESAEEPVRKVHPLRGRPAGYR